MATTNAQILTIALQTAKVPGFTSQAEIIYNAILSQLCQEYDFDVAKKAYNFTLTPAGAAIGNLNATTASGPFALPADYLRAKIGDVFVYPIGLNNVPYRLTPIDLEEFDGLMQQVGFLNYPAYWVTDMSQSPPIAYVWPPAAGSYPALVRYYRQMPDIATPSTSTAAPWFPNTQFLITELAGRMMQVAGDDRWEAFLSDNEEMHPSGSRVILRRYLQMKDDSSNRAKRIKLDERRFGTSWGALPKTKVFPW